MRLEAFEDRTVPATTLSAAVNLGSLAGQKVVTDSVGIGNVNDYYKFSVPAAGSLTVSLEGLTADADVQVIRDANNNGEINGGEMIGSSGNSGTTSELISALPVTAVTYYIRVLLFSDNTDYTLTLTPEYAGQTLATARGLGVQTGVPKKAGDFIGIGNAISSDSNDFYKFTLTVPSAVSIGLGGMTADADLHLIKDANNNNVLDGGEVLVSSGRGGNAPEFIGQTLAAGAYFIQVQPFTGDTSYTLSLQSDSAGNTPAAARNLGTLTTGSNRVFGDYVGGADFADIYQFTVTSPVRASLALSMLSADADVDLAQDSDSNGIIDGNEVIASSNNDGKAAELVPYQMLSPGTYFIRVLPFAGSTSYSLSFQTDFAGNTPNEARDIGTVTAGTRTFGDGVNGTDGIDFYKFTLSENGTVSLGLTGLTADADLFLARDSNNDGNVDDEVIIASANGGTSPEAINFQHLDAGVYYVRVLLFSGTGTGYTLSMTTTYSGGTLTTARNIGPVGVGTDITFNDTVSSTDATDVYRFSVTATTRVTIQAFVLTGTVDFDLIFDNNNNGLVDAGDGVTTQRVDNPSVGKFATGEFGPPGPFFVRIRRVSDAEYNLRFFEDPA